MRNYILLLFIATFTLPSSSFSQIAQKDAGFASIKELAIQGQLEFLASDWMRGRELGTKGAYMASDYLASLYKEMGLKPGGDYARSSYRGRRSSSQAPQVERPRTYFQNFTLIETTQEGNPECSLINRNGHSRVEVPLLHGVDFTFQAGSRSIEAEAPLVFIGYGINDPTVGYNDYAKVDVKGKIVVRLMGYPGFRDPGSKGYSKFNKEDEGNITTIERNKDRWATEAGAIGVIDVGRGFGRATASPANLPFRYNEANYEGDVPFREGPRSRYRRPESLGTGGFFRIGLSPEILNKLIEDQSINLEAYEKKAAEKVQPASQVLKDQYLFVKSTISTRVVNARNVVGILEGKNKDECITIGAHFDHLGENKGFIYNGSDDNASGCVGVMTIARAIIASGIQPEVSLVFCAWTGEEKGLIGSSYFADHPAIEKINCYMNYDMISRVDPKDPTKIKCDYNSTSTLPLLEELAKRHVKEYNLSLDVAYVSSERPRGGSDFSSFSAKGIPIFLVHGKFTPDYHQYTDHADKADLSYFTDIIRLGYLNIFELATKSW